MEHAELSSSVIFVCHVNFSRRLEAESAAFSVLFIVKKALKKYKKYNFTLHCDTQEQFSIGLYILA